MKFKNEICFFCALLLFLPLYGQQVDDEVVFLEDFENLNPTPSKNAGKYTWSSHFQDSIYTGTPEKMDFENSALLMNFHYDEYCITMNLPCDNSSDYLLSWDYYLSENSSSPQMFLLSGDETERFQLPVYPYRVKAKWTGLNILLSNEVIDMSYDLNRNGYFSVVNKNYTQLEICVQDQAALYYVDNIQLKKVDNLLNHIVFDQIDECPIETDSMIFLALDAYKKTIRNLPPGINVENNTLQLIVDEDAEESLFDLYIVNQTDRKTSKYHHAHWLFREAKNEAGEWLPIENVRKSVPVGRYDLPTSRFLLAPFESYQILDIPKYVGDFETEIRFKLLFNKVDNIVSNSYKGFINKSQFIPMKKF